MHKRISTTEAGGILAGIHRKLRWVAAGVPLFLLIVVAVDGITWTDAGVVLFVTAILWLFVFIAGFTVGALRQHGDGRT
jgi:4-amino-4-deoxy-L-arabinose transferase-like glycosyltransferase